MSFRKLVYQTLIEADVTEVFDFFSKAENLNLITPPELNFEIISGGSGNIRAHQIIDYKIRLNGIPFKWKTKITHWNPPYSFEDTQLEGPYRKWVHLHSFSELKPNKTLMTDKVLFIVPGGFFEPVIYHLIVKPRLEYIFNYRMKTIKSIFNSEKAVQQSIF